MAALLVLGLPGAALAGQWGTPEATPGPDGLNAAVLAPDGSITAIWRKASATDACDPYTTDPGCEVRVARLTADGWSVAHTLSTADAYYAGIRLVVDGEGNVTALWLQTNGGTLGASAWASRWSNGAWSEAQQLSAGGLAVYYTALAVNADGVVVAAWSDSIAGDVQTATFSEGSWSNAVTVPDGGQTSDLIETLAPEPDGSFTMLAQRTSSDQIGAARLAGGTWTDQGLISPSGRSADGASIVFAADGTAMAVWTSPVSGRNVIESARRSGGVWASPTPVSSSSDSSTTPLLALDATGAITAVWNVNTSSGSYTDLAPAYARYTNGAWSTPGALQSITGMAVINALIRDETGAPVAVYIERPGQSWVSNSTRFANGVWSSARPLEPTATWRDYQVSGTAWGGAVALGFNMTLLRFGPPPGAPRDVRAEAGDRAIRVRWDAPAPPRAAFVTGYTATAEPGGATCTTTGETACTITGLLAGSTYRVTVAATSMLGTGTGAAAGASVTLAGGGGGGSGNPPVVGRIAPSPTGERAAVTIPVTVPAPGQVTITGWTAARGPAGRAQPRRVWRCTARETFTRAGTRVLRCDLRQRARRVLQRGALRMAFDVVFAPADGSARERSVARATIPRRR